MSDLDPRIWAEAIARALTVGGERVPFQRILSTHRAGLDALRDRGLTWRSLAHLLAQAGARRPDGSPYDADHLRICVKRMSPPTAGSRSVAIRPAADRHTSHSSMTSAAIPRTHGDRPARPTPAQAQRPPPLREASTDVDKDVSSDEVALVRARLNQLRK